MGSFGSSAIAAIAFDVIPSDAWRQTGFAASASSVRQTPPPAAATHSRQRPPGAQSGSTASAVMRPDWWAGDG